MVNVLSLKTFKNILFCKTTLTMKYVIIGDLHGADLSKLEVVLRKSPPDVLICTGDFDQTKTIHQYMELVSKFLNAGKEVITVPGNHDHAIYTNLDIYSGTLRKQGKTSQELHNELMRDDVAKNFINQLLYSIDKRYTNHRVRIHLDEEKYKHTYQTMITHGGYEGDLSSYPDCPRKIKNLWVRLHTKEDHRKNFEVMARKGYNVMIRGHDHEASYVFQDPSLGIVMDVPYQNHTAFPLSIHRRHTITPGALADGLYATIKTSIPGVLNPILEFHTVK